jgi:hypothetical protein
MIVYRFGYDPNVMFVILGCESAFGLEIAPIAKLMFPIQTVDKEFTTTLFVPPTVVYPKSIIEA